MKEVEKRIEEIKTDLQKKIDIIQEKTNKKIFLVCNLEKTYIQIDYKIINFKMPSTLSAYVNGMYKIAKDL